MMNSKVLLGITILSTALGGACATGEQGSGGSGGGSSGASATGGGNATGGSSALGGTVAGNSGSGGAVTSGGSTSSGGATGTGGATSAGGTTSSSSIGSGGANGGTTGGTGGATGGATGATGGGFGRGGGTTGGTTGTGGATGGGSGGRGGTTGTGGATGGGSGGRGGATATGGVTGMGGATGGATGGTTGSGGATGGATGAGGATSTGALPALHVEGPLIKDPNGKTIILRGSALIDIGALYAYGGNSVAGISARMDKIAAAGVQGHLVRMPVYPKIDYNGGGSYCSPLPYPVGGTGSANCTPTAPMTAADYVSKVLKPAVDYATSKNLYVIIDHHQIDNATTGNSAADATAFWTDVAPKFASYNNVIYEPFNEPIDGSVSWAAFKSVAQGWINTIRTGAPDNIIIVPSMSYDQHPGDAASNPPTGTNLAYTAHIYPGNWSTSFQTQVATAVAKAPVFITEWGYVLNGSDKNLGTSSATWGTNFEAKVDGYGASWTAWVTDNSWTPSMFSNSALTTLSNFGTVAKNWLAAKAGSDWVQ